MLWSLTADDIAARRVVGRSTEIDIAIKSDQRAG